MWTEATLLTGAAALYLAATAVAIGFAARGRSGFDLMIGLLVGALLLHSGAIGLRWARLGHGPYVDLFEILSSNVWSLHLVLVVTALVWRAARPALTTALPVLAILVIWMLATPIKDTAPPVTYQTIWLPIHVFLGKVFLGLTVVAVGLALIVILRERFDLRLPDATGDARTEETAYRLMLVAVVFQTLMLIAGAAWARDAWGRYWAWDPLESWSFMTWLATLAYLHWRPGSTGRHATGALMIVGIYVLAFATFFGVPFISTAPHKGAI